MGLDWIKGVCVTCAATCLLMFSASPAAAATIRFAHPLGTGGAPCTQQGPTDDNICSLNTALNASASGDQVVMLTTGTFGSFGATVSVPPGVLLRGNAPGAAPTISSAGGGFAAVDVKTGASIRDLKIVVGNASPPIQGVSFQENSRIDRVAVTAKSSDIACRMDGGGTVMRDSVCQAGTNGGRAIEAYGDDSGSPITLRNVTAFNNTINGTALRALGGAATPLTVYATNFVAWGDDDGTNKDVNAAGDGTPNTTTIVIDHSNLSSSLTQNMGVIVDGGGNVNSPIPDFLSEDIGDFHQEPTSTGTIDRGTAAVVNGVGPGPYDYEGLPRCAGAAPDIGASELTGAACPVPAEPAPEPGPIPAGPAQRKKCKKGKKLKKGKCVKKKKKRKKRR